MSAQDKHNSRAGATAGRRLRARGQARGVADEGGYWPEFEDTEEVLAFLVEAIAAAGCRPGEDGSIALDIAASNLYDAASARYLPRSAGRSSAGRSTRSRQSSAAGDGSISTQKIGCA